MKIMKIDIILKGFLRYNLSIRYFKLTVTHYMFYYISLLLKITHNENKNEKKGNYFHVKPIDFPTLKRKYDIIAFIPIYSNIFLCLSKKGECFDLLYHSIVFIACRQF